jgi:hypothetical protein
MTDHPMACADGLESPNNGASKSVDGASSPDNQDAVNNRCEDVSDNDSNDDALNDWVGAIEVSFWPFYMCLHPSSG